MTSRLSSFSLAFPVLLAAAMPTPGLAAGHHKVPETAVRATLSDGQILMGEVHTRTLLLRSGSGDLEIPLDDVGEVVPASGGKLGEAEGRVDVWLRNGSELRGTWAEPKLAMSIQVGGADVPVDLPMNDLSRFQLQGGARWPGGPIYRMRTRFGDDFLVDPSRTHLVVVNDFGTFEPLLSECQYVAPIGDPQGPWRIQLQTGTVLVGKLADDKVTVALPMGPSEVSVPLAQFVSLQVESWNPIGAAPRVEDGRLQGLARDDRARDEARADDGPRKDSVAVDSDPVDPVGVETALGAGYGGPVAEAGAVDVAVDQPVEEPFAAAAPESIRAGLSESRSSGRAAPSRAPAARAAPAAAAPAPADAWFDSTDLAKSKSKGE